MAPLGYAWLIQHLQLRERSLAVTSQLGARLRTLQQPGGSLQQQYPPHYAPETSLSGHLEFALKHEGVNLSLLQDIFRACGPAPVEAVIHTHPTSKYSRLLGFYYELTTGQTLNPALAVGGNYVAALAAEDYVVAPRPQRHRRWRILDNLPGDARFCPLVRRTPAVVQNMAAPLQIELQALIDGFPPALSHRASDYLYLKETRSTYGIEHEVMPPADRTRRFVALLRAAGSGSLASLLTEPELVQRQHLIVDPRYAVNGYRNHQNYVGEQRPDYSQRIHYVCPPPSLVPALMAGLAACAERTAGLHPIVRAALIAFGLVFIHPFEDGNGRLHRFLIHDLLHRDGFIPAGVILPVSATMLRRLPEYDAALEYYSRPLMQEWVSYELDEEGRLTVTNPETVEAYYRFPDLTRQVEYLLVTVALSIREDFAGELRFLRGYDTAREAVRHIVDMPDRRLDLLLRLLHQNQGRLSRTKRPQFAELTEAEIRAIEAAFAEAFAIGD